MRFTPTDRQKSIFALAALAYEKLGEPTSAALDKLGCESLQLDGRRGQVKYIQEMFSRDGHCDMNAEHRIAARAALELHKKDVMSAEKKMEQLELATDEPEDRIEAIYEFIHDIDEQLELHPDSEEERESVSLDDHIREHGDPSEDVSLDNHSSETNPAPEDPVNVDNIEVGQEWMEGGKSYIRAKNDARGGRIIIEITNMGEKERKNLRRSILRPSRAKN